MKTSMSSLCVTISPLKKHKETVSFKELKELEDKKGLKPAKVGRLMAEKLGTNPKTEAALYSFFRRGERAIPESRISILAEIFGVNNEELFRINTLFNDERSCSLELTFDSKLQFKDLMRDVPESITTLDEFLVWLSTETERRSLMSRL